MRPSNDFDTAARLAWLRCFLAGEGAFASRAADGVETATAVLPGEGFILRLERSGAAGHGRLFYPSGRPLSVRMPLADPQAFASLLHNVDCSIAGGPAERTARAEPGDLADALVASAVPALRRLVDGAMAAHPDLDHADGEGKRRLPAGAVALVEACRAAEDPDVRAAAERLAALSGGEVGRRPFDAGASIVAWHERVDAWLSPEEPADVVEAGERVWRRVRTAAGVVAVARRLGLLEGDLLRRPIAEGDLPPAVRRAGRMARFMQVLQGAPSAPPEIGPARAFHALHDADGTLVAVAVREGDDLVLRGPHGKEGEALMEGFDALIALRRALGMDGGAPSP